MTWRMHVQRLKAHLETAQVILQEFGIHQTPPEAPKVVAFHIQHQTARRFAMLPEGSEGDPQVLEEFVNSVLEGTAARIMKSQPVPEPPHDMEGHVQARDLQRVPPPLPPSATLITACVPEKQVVVSASFDKVVRGSGKDAFLFVSAPWCQHCQELAPVWESLAKRFSRIPSVLIAKMDGTGEEGRLAASCC